MSAHTDVIRETIRALTNDIARIIALAQDRNRTLDRLQRLGTWANFGAEELRQLAGNIPDVGVGENSVIGDYVDPDDKFIDMLDEYAWTIQTPIVAQLSGVAESADHGEPQEERLRGAHRDCIEPLRLIADACRELRSAIISHDLDAEPAPSEWFEPLSNLPDIRHGPLPLVQAWRFSRRFQEDYKKLRNNVWVAVRAKLYGLGGKPDSVKHVPESGKPIYAVDVTRDAKVSILVKSCTAVLRRVDCPEDVDRAP